MAGPGNCPCSVQFRLVLSLWYAFTHLQYSQHGVEHLGHFFPGRTHCSIPRARQVGQRTPGICWYSPVSIGTQLKHRHCERDRFTLHEGQKTDRKLTWRLMFTISMLTISQGEDWSIAGWKGQRGRATIAGIAAVGWMHLGQSLSGKILGRRSL